LFFPLLEAAENARGLQVIVSGSLLWIWIRIWRLWLATSLNVYIMEWLWFVPSGRFIIALPFSRRKNRHYVPHAWWQSAARRGLSFSVSPQQSGRLHKHFGNLLLLVGVCVCQWQKFVHLICAKFAYNSNWINLMTQWKVGRWAVFHRLLK